MACFRAGGQAGLLTQTVGLVVGNGLFNFFRIVHYKRPVVNNWLT
jgi:hypothetical protein